MTMFLQTPQVYGEMQEQLIRCAEVRPVYNTFRAFRTSKNILSPGYQCEI